MRTVVVIPTIRDLHCLEDWRGEFDRPEVQVLAVEDHDKHEIQVPLYKFNPIRVYSRNDVNADLHKKAWIFPKFSSARRSYGIWKAWQLHPDMIVTLDDDCFPERPDYFLKEHWNNLQYKVCLGWTTSIPQTERVNFAPRGYPYLPRNKFEIMVSHGLWSNVPDLDAPTQLTNPDLRMREVTTRKLITLYNYFPMCGMNLAFKPQVADLMYFGLQGPEWPFQQFDDIWAGIVAKKILDINAFGVVSGCPSVRHDRASNVYKNLEAQTPGITVNEKFWVWVDEILVDKSDEKYLGPELNYIYREIAKVAEATKVYPEYFKKLAEAAQIWTSLFN